MLIIPQEEFVHARKESIIKSTKVFFMDDITPIIIKRIKMPMYAMLLKAIQNVEGRMIYLQMFLSAEIAEDIPYLEEHTLNEARVRGEKDIHKYVTENLAGITADSTFCCDFDMHLDVENPKYYKCTAISSLEENGVHEEITLMIPKNNFFILSLFLYQITSREEFIHVFTDDVFQGVEYIPITSFTKNSSCVIKVGKEKKVLTHYQAYIGPRKFGFSSVDNLNESKELNNKMPEDEWKEWYKDDSIISNILYDERIIDGELTDVIDILYPDTTEIEDKDGKVQTIYKPFKVLQVKLSIIERQSNFINPDVIYKKK